MVSQICIWNIGDTLPEGPVEVCLQETDKEWRYVSERSDCNETHRQKKDRNDAEAFHTHQK